MDKDHRIDQVNTFVDHVYTGLTGHVAIVTLGDTGELNSERFFELPKELNTVKRFAALRLDEDVYLSTAAFPEPSRKTNANAEARAVYADADACPPEKFRVPPTISVRTSEGRWHCWWVLDETVSATEASRISHKIAFAHKDDGCDSGWAISKLLRVPGTTNTKRVDHEVVVATYGDDVYTLDTLDAVYDDVDFNAQDIARTQAPQVDEVMLGELEERLDALGLARFYTTVPPEGSDWSQYLYRFEMELLRSGFSPEEVFQIAREAACNKFHPDLAGTGKRPRRADADGDLWRDVQKAATEFSFEGQLTPEEQAVQKQQPQAAEMGEFITHEERQWLEANPGFPEQYTDWVRESGTDASPVFNRTLAYMILSCVYGDLGYLAYHSDTRLNLWALILAGSTHNRKTTAMKRALTVIHAWEEVGGEKIDFANDATSEGLNKALADRDGLVSLMNTDEVQGWFEEAMSKNYRSGALATLSKLYDGKAEVSLRASKDAGNVKRASTVFNFFGVGIRDHVARVLTKENFESGFLPRFVWAVADQPKVNIFDDDLSNDLIDRSKQIDSYPEVQKFVTKFAQQRRALGAKLRIVAFDDEAIERYNEWVRSVNVWLRDAEGVEFLDTAASRLKVSVQKAMGLLALHAGRDTITVGDVISGLAQAELWFRDMVRMANEVSSSDFERRVDEIETFIASGREGQRSVTLVRDKFKRYRVAEQDEYINQLVQRGRIRRVSAERGGPQVLEALTV